MVPVAIGVVQDFDVRVFGEHVLFAANSSLKVLNNANGDWDHAKAQQVMSSILASQPNIDGVFTQDGMVKACFAH